MKLYLTKLPADKVIGSYGDNEDILKDAKLAKAKGDAKAELALFESMTVGTMAVRLRALSPEAARDYLRMMDEEDPMLHPIVTDMYRSPESSLHISQIPGRNALPPSESGHQYGLSLDAHTRAMMKRARMKRKADLDALFAKYNFFNFWVDGKNEHPTEDWHFNHLPPEFRDRSGGFSSDTTRGYLEQMILAKYGSAMDITETEAQIALKKLGDYDGEVDGKFGRLSKAAVVKFQSRWMPSNRTGKLDKKTERLLAYLTAEVVWVPPAA